ncbi:MAG: hypothetical protein F6K11_11000 [Leptolyngbya sp. SIO3F4]|nr:hypothetical protein [Leptolyngbya sp. SIO3F4]
MSDSKSSQSIQISGGDFSQVQIGQAGGDVKQVFNVNEASDEMPTSEEIVATLQEIVQLLNDSQLGAEQKRKATRYVEAAKEAVTDDEPDKRYVAGSLQQATKIFKEASTTVEAGQGLWDRVKPLVTKLIPYLGVAVSFFA